MKRRPPVNPWRLGFTEGYQEALNDIATALAEGGEQAALTWITNNRATPAPAPAPEEN